MTLPFVLCSSLDLSLSFDFLGLFFFNTNSLVTCNERSITRLLKLRKIAGGPLEISSFICFKKARCKPSTHGHGDGPDTCCLAVSLAQVYFSKILNTPNVGLLSLDSKKTFPILRIQIRLSCVLEPAHTCLYSISVPGLEVPTTIICILC